jgi:hypothetical protein
LAEWHLPPGYINRHWTEELLALMFLKRNERLSPESKEDLPKPAGTKTVSNEDFFKLIGKYGHTVERIN